MLISANRKVLSKKQDFISISSIEIEDMTLLKMSSLELSIF